MKRLLAFLILLLPSLVSATTTITGHIADVGTIASGSGAFVRFTLQGCSGNQPTVPGVAILAPSNGASWYKDFPADSSGNVNGTIYSTRDASGNGGGEISCGGSFTSVYYNMSIWVNGLSGPNVAVHAKNGTTLDVTNVTPITTTPVITAPTGDTTYLRLDGGNSPVTGPVTFPGITASSMNGGIILANNVTYPCTSFITAFAAGGIVDARGCTGTQSVTSNPLPSPTKPGTLWLGNTTFQTTATWTMLQGLLIYGTGIGSPGFGPTLIQAVSGFPSTSPVLTLDAAGANSVRVESLGIDCNNQTGAIGVQVNDSEEETMLRHVTVTGCPNIGIAIGDGLAGHAQNSGPYEDLYVTPGNATVTAGTIPIKVNANTTAFRGIHGATVDFHAASTHPTDCIVISTPGTYSDIHAEGCVNGLHVKASNVYISNIQCGSGPFAMSTCILIDAALSDVTVAHIFATNNMTNVLVDNRNSVTLTVASEGDNLGFYSIGAGPDPVPILTT
jgi:hypothetical protein